MPRVGDEANERPTPDALREGVRSAIHSALVLDVEKRGGRTGGHLVLSGVIGVAGALGVTWLVAEHPYGHHPHWHLAFYSTMWAGLLIVALALAVLDVRTPRWPISNASRAALLALAVAGFCAWICPDQHFLTWWGTTDAGSWLLHRTDSLVCSAFCFGSVWAAIFAILAALPTLPQQPGIARTVLLTSALVALLQAPGIALQSTDLPGGVLAGWLGGSTLGSIAGVAGAALLRSVSRSPDAARR